MPIIKTVTILFFVLMVLNIQTAEAKTKKNDKKAKSTHVKS